MAEHGIVVEPLGRELVARARGTASDAGELIDAAVDRYAEIATFAGIAAYYRAYPPGFWLALASLGGALLVSYARAKGEISGIDARMGAMNRGERGIPRQANPAQVGVEIEHHVRR